MGDVDIAVRQLSKLYPEEICRLAIKDILIRGKPELLEKELIKVERRVDCLYKANTEKGSEFIAHIEFQVEHKWDIPSRIFEYAGLLHKEFKLPIVSSVVYLRAERYKEIPECLDIILDGRLINRYTFNVVKLWELPWRDYKESAFMPLLSLMKVEEPEEVLGYVSKGLKGEKELSAIAYILCGLKYESKILERFFSKEELMESVTYREILEEGYEKGIEKGMEKGKREDLLGILEIRFGVVPMRLVKEIEGLEDVKVLDMLLRKAMAAGDIKEFEEILKKVME